MLSRISDLIFKRNLLKQIVIGAGVTGLLFMVSCANHTDINKAKSIFYLVQPAEHYAGFDGHLSWYGRLRAGDLMRMLKDSGVQKIYVTPFARSVETIDSLRSLQSIDTVEYIIDSSGVSILKLLKQRKDFGRRVLIVVRPFVIPKVIRRLGVDFTEDTVSEDGFNLLYVIRNNKGKASLKQQPFGKRPNPPKNNGQVEDDSIQSALPMPTHSAEQGVPQTGK